MVLRLSLRVLLALAAPSAAADVGGHWIDHAPLGVARQETGAALLGGRVYVVGGMLASSNATTAVEAYDPALDVWTAVAPLPAPRDHAMVAAADGRLWVIGGFAGDFFARAHVFVYDPALDSWSSGPPLPQARGAGWAVELGGRVYVFGGVDTSSAVRRTTFVLDVATGVWTTGADMPTAREHLNAVVLGEHVYVLGGRSGSSFAANERYHPASDTWTALAPMPTARSAMGAVALDGRILAMGGETPMLFDVVEVYDPRADAWSRQTPMPVPRHGVAAVALADRVLLPGGGVVQGLQPTAHVDAFVPAGHLGAVRYCTPTPNSTGAAALMESAGSASVTANDLRLLAVGLPPHQSGRFVYAPDEAETPLGNGNLCVAPGSLGFVARLPAGTSDATGILSHEVDLASPPAPAATITPGSTWHFTAWFRDVPAGGAGFDFADGLRILFAP